MASDLIVRGYSEGDVPDMARIWNRVVEDGEAFPQEDTLSEDEARGFFGSQTHCGVAILEGKPVGLYILHPNNVGRCGHICNCSFAVDPGCRGHGVGAALVEDSLAAGRDAGFRIMQFNAVVKENLTAIGLYERLGFIRIGEVPGGFRHAEGAYHDILLYYHEL